MDFPSENSEYLSAEDSSDAAVVFGGGLAGLSAGYALTRRSRNAMVFEADSSVGGLSKTLEMDNFRFDIGGHRFHTKKRDIEELVRTLMGDELATVSRKSKIFMRNRLFDYPLRPANAMFGLGVGTVLRILLDYGWEKLKGSAANGDHVSLEDWVVSSFGRTMYDIYFKEYSEKVWGLECDRISQSWVSKRIQGLSLGSAIKNAFFRFSGREIPTLADNFLYPELGIGRISERFKEEICSSNRLFTDTGIAGLSHDGRRITSVEVRNCGRSCTIEGEGYISTIPLNKVVLMLRPEPPEGVLHAARSLGFRDLVIVPVTVNREYVTNQSWVYIPEKKYPFGRLHEPKCWSSKMAPPDKTLLVVEYFCFKGDDVWNSTDEELSETTVSGLEKLGFIRRDEVLDTKVFRIPKAYPLFEVGYEKHCETIYKYLDGFENLFIAGRSGMFQYQNMDHAIASGIEAAEDFMGGKKRP
jgi:protoporphyrinogen oxidase